MKITYYRYWIEHKLDRHRQSMCGLIDSFAKVRSRKFRESFVDGSDNLFLYPIREHLYLFVITKDRELIKAISENTMAHEDIYRKLSAGERIGFGSYVYLGPDFFGIASTIHGPKAKRLGGFFTQILRAAGIDNCAFCCAPFELQTSPKDASLFSFKGAVRMAVKRNCGLFQSIMSWGNTDGEDVDEVVVEIRPAVRKQMKTTFDAVLHRAKERGIESMVVRAKAELEDQLLDFHVIGQGGLSSPIREKSEQDICNAILQDVQENGSLQEELSSYREDRAYETDGIQIVRDYSDVRRWLRHLGLPGA